MFCWIRHRDPVLPRRLQSWHNGRVVPAIAVTLLAAAVEITGASTCPEPAAVAAGLAAVLPDEGGSGPPDVATLVPTGDGRAVQVELRRADGLLLASRLVPAGSSCDEAAEIVAVVIASWEARFRSGLEGALEMDVRRPPAPPPRRRLIQVGAAGLLSLQNGDVAPGGMLEVTVGLGSGRLALRAAPLLVWDHDAALLPGNASWSRTGLAMGVRLRLSHRGIWADAAVDLLATALLNRGTGFSVERRLWSFDPGATAWLRGGLVLGRFEPWVGAALTVWPRTQILMVENLPGQEVRLSHMELFFAAGLSLRFGG